MGALAIAVVVVAAGDVLTLTLLLGRRVLLDRAGRRREAVEARLRPVALALLEGTAPSTRLSRRDSPIFAELVGRYARSVRGPARTRAAEFFESSGDVRRQLRDLERRTPWRRARAASVLGEMASPDAVEPLVRRLADADADVRIAAARALGHIGSAAAVKPLVVVLASRSVSEPVAGQALLSIGADSAPALLRLVRDPDARVRTVAVRLLGFVGDAADGPAIVGRLRDPAAEVRADAARTLARLGDSEAVDELRRGLDDRIPFVRTATATALGHLNDRAALPRLLEQARTDVADAARAAAYAAARIDAGATAAAAGLDDAGPYLGEAADVAAVGWL